MDATDIDVTQLGLPLLSIFINGVDLENANPEEEVSASQAEDDGAGPMAKENKNNDVGGASAPKYVKAVTLKEVINEIKAFASERQVREEKLMEALQKLSKERAQMSESLGHQGESVREIIALSPMFFNSYVNGKTKPSDTEEDVILQYEILLSAQDTKAERREELQKLLKEASERHSLPALLGQMTHPISFSFIENPSAPPVRLSGPPPKLPLTAKVVVETLVQEMQAQGRKQELDSVLGIVALEFKITGLFFFLSFLSLELATNLIRLQQRKSFAY